jgi:hypothetical protein
VSIVDAATGVSIDPERPIKSNFAEAGYMTQVDERGQQNRDTDRLFHKIERRIFERVREVRPRHCDAEHRDAVIELCTIHLLRTQDFRDAQLRVLARFEAEAVEDFGGWLMVHQWFMLKTGVPPPPPGLIESWKDMWMNRQRAGAVFFESTQHRINNIDTQLHRWHLQVVEIDPTLPGLALGDNPVVHADLATRRFGFRDELAVGDASIIMAPLSRRVAVFFSSEPQAPVAIQTHKLLDQLNALTARNARSEVACHPDDTRRVQRVCRDVKRYLPPGGHLEVRRRV